MTVERAILTVEQEAFAALERKLIEEKARLQKEAENQVARVNAAAVLEPEVFNFQTFTG